MTFEELRKQNLTRCNRWHPGGIVEWSLSDWAVAAAGEMGEACNVVKKLNRERDGLVGNDKSAEQLQQDLADEIADVVIYLDILAAHAGIQMSEAVRSKFNRTSEKNGFPERLR
jgi:NTP pyrophosphatase (non-canonical NTP hydrolase)